MAKNIRMKQKNSSSFEVLYPETTIDQVVVSDINPKTLRQSKYRKMYTLFEGNLSTGTSPLTLPNEVNSFSEFDEIIVVGSIVMNSASMRKDFHQTFQIFNNEDFTFSDDMTILYTGSTTKDTYWIRGRVELLNSQISISYNRKIIGTGNAEEGGSDNAITKVVGIKYTLDI